MGFGSFLARPFKDINKAVKKVGGGVNKAVKSVGGGAGKAVSKVGSVMTGRPASGKSSIGPSDKLKKKLMGKTEA